MKRRGTLGEAELVLVNIHPIKSWAATRLNAHSALRRVLEGERESIPPDEFVAKLGVWLRLLEIEESGR